MSDYEPLFFSISLPDFSSKKMVFLFDFGKQCSYNYKQNGNGEVWDKQTRVKNNK